MVEKEALKGTGLELDVGTAEYNVGEVFGRKLYQSAEQESFIASARAEGPETKLLRIAADDFRLIMASQGSHINGSEDIMNAELPSEFKNPVPFRLEDFQVIGLVGYGSFGKVSLVREQATKQIFALKEVSKRRVISTGQIEHIINEKRVMSIIDSPFCVKLFRFIFLFI
ncbi:Protein kinase domain containing protein [Reticulomyxa filosa]|uniref:Protein kinase domain containing protein n=1 Tax=Reticulomyxa filosa TaxID=46433 RepID=X6NDS2_RETFI|nr:Protein kinase domain containing protein [Reticulomyxa filosa]|eukprot:ETO24151.1 Protein kinase domain containing protein [Reticulomyxa filosa]